MLCHAVLLSFIAFPVVTSKNFDDVIIMNNEMTPARSQIEKVADEKQGIYFAWPYIQTY